MSKKILKQMAIKLVEDNLKKYFNTSFELATDIQLFKALASAVTDELFEIRKKDVKVAATGIAAKRPIKSLHYLSIEFLAGRTLKNTLFNLGWDNVFASALKQKGIDIKHIFDIEADAGLGNGGLGRLAACFMDSLATLNYPATAHCIKYEYGLFKQKIIDGQQVEFLDEWLTTGGVWLTARPDEAVVVRFGGEVRFHKGKDGRLKFVYDGAQEVDAIPYDMRLSGYNSKAVSTLKLWSAKSKNRGDVSLSHGEFVNYAKESKEIENINSVLYPSDDLPFGRTLRLKQQYFLCSASMQNLVNTHLRKKNDLKNLFDYTAIHINDTHPAMCIPELMRILMDEHSFTWDESWKIVTKCVSYTNHTVLQEALEIWSADSLIRVVPRIYQIICEIDRRHREALVKAKRTQAVIERMSLVSNGGVRMANLAIVASHKVNGVSKIHSEILKDKIFKDFAELTPDKFINITNGVTHRRWMSENNPMLADLITSVKGDNSVNTNAKALAELKKHLDDQSVLKKINQIKYANKVAFANWLKQNQGIEIDPSTRFDVLIKRIHEYKRQLLNILRVIHLFNILKKDPNADVTPQTFIFAGKAASGYFMAKRIIKLINQVANEIDKDPIIRKILKVVFVENYSVTISEILIPATEVTQQISLAGQEASGTGNMKAVMNGALMMCTWDGANAEITTHCGDGGNFTFGLSPSEVEQTWRDGYNPIDIYNANPNIGAVIDALNYGFNGESFHDISSYLLGTANRFDNYMCLADFQDFMNAHEKMDALYRKPMEWAKMALRNISNMGYFSSDRAIQEYVELVWDLTKIK